MRISTAFPTTVLTNEQIANEHPEVNVSRLEKKLGIKSRRVTQKGESALDLAVEACKGYTSEELATVDFVIYCSQSPEYFLPSTACLLQKALNLKTSCGAFDYNLGCSGYIYGLAMAKSFIGSGVASTVLLVTAETYSKFVHNSDWSNKAIFGDGATATLLKLEDADKIGAFDLGTDGGGAENLIVKAGAAANDFQNDDTVNGFLSMNGPEVFQFTLENVPLTVESCLRKNNLTLNDVDFTILHQANAYMLKNLRKKLNIPEEKFYIDVEHVGNTVSSTIPIALKDSIDKGLVKTGDCVLLCGFGVGYSWGATVITI